MHACRSTLEDPTLGAHIAYLLDWVDGDPRLPHIRRILDKLQMAWAGTWARYATDDRAVALYQAHLQEADMALAVACKPPVMMRNRWGLLDSLRRYVFANAISPQKRQARAGVAPGDGVRAIA